MLKHTGYYSSMLHEIEQKKDRNLVIKMFLSKFLSFFETAKTDNSFENVL